MSATPTVATVNALAAGDGDGLVADAAVLAELGCRAVCVASSVVPSEALSVSQLAGQLDRLRREPSLSALRIGFLQGRGQVELVAALVGELAPQTAVVSWPAADAETEEAVTRLLFPAARVVVARASELGSGEGVEVGEVETLRSDASALRQMGARAVLLAGLVVRGRVLDLLDDGGKVSLFDAERVRAVRVAGLSGAHAASLAAHLARGLTLSQSAEAAQRYVGHRLRRGR